MEVTFAVLADYANVSREGKVNVMGLFTIIYADKFPATHPEMQLVFNLEAHAAERGRKKKVEIVLVDADGKRLQELRAELTVPTEGSSLTIGINQIVRLVGVTFEHPGQHEFVILVDGDKKASVPFTLEKTSPGK